MVTVALSPHPADYLSVKADEPHPTVPGRVSWSNCDLGRSLDSVRRAVVCRSRSGRGACWRGLPRSGAAAK